jgi:uncharacterized phage protein gp47/JayE
MAVSLTSLLSTVTETAALEKVLGLYSSLGFRVTSWVSGGTGLTVARILARLLSEHSPTVQAIAKGGLLEWAEGDWLTLLADDFYDVQRTPATRARHTVRLTCAASAGPYTLTASQVWLATDSGVRFRSVTGGVLASGSYLDITVEAELAGTSGNVAGGTITSLVTSLAGVTATNTATTVLAVDEELDPELRQRCRDKWASVAPQDAAPGGTYRYWARKASSSVTRVYVDDNNPDGPGSLRVYLAGNAGPVASDVSNAVNAVLQQRRAAKAIVATLSAVERVCTMTGTVYVSGTDSGAAATAIEAAVVAEFAAYDIGGEVLGTRGIWQSRIIDAIHDCGINVRRVAPSGSWDFALEPYEVATPDLTLTVVIV